jgi:hypothetical protein
MCIISGGRTDRTDRISQHLSLFSSIAISTQTSTLYPRWDVLASSKTPPLSSLMTCRSRDLDLNLDLERLDQPISRSRGKTLMPSQQHTATNNPRKDQPSKAVTICLRHFPPHAATLEAISDFLYSACRLGETSGPLSGDFGSQRFVRIVFSVLVC